MDTKSNLEPIEESDLNLEKKFRPEMVASEEKQEMKPETTPAEKEMSKEVSASEKEIVYQKILSSVKSSSQPAADETLVSSDAEQVFQKSDEEGKIQHLVELALNKGVVHAVKVARHLEDNYALDMFHDRLLADELRDALVKNGLIKEV